MCREARLSSHIHQAHVEFARQDSSKSSTALSLHKDSSRILKSPVNTGDRQKGKQLSWSGAEPAEGTSLHLSLQCTKLQDSLGPLVLSRSGSDRAKKLASLQEGGKRLKSCGVYKWMLESVRFAKSPLAQGVCRRSFLQSWRHFILVTEIRLSFS